eukprot:2801691-Alexandrium_andersonii.AAC.1
MSCGAIPRRVLRFLAGKRSYFAGLIPRLRPFVKPLGANGCAPDAPRPPAAMVHVCGVAPTPGWAVAFLSVAHGPLARRFRATARYVPTVWTIAADASPWGTGAVLSGPRGVV